MKISSEVLLVDDSKPTDFLFSSYNSDRREWIDWGVIRDHNIKQVLVNNKKAALINVKTYDFRLCYLIGSDSDRNIPPTHKFSY